MPLSPSDFPLEVQAAFFVYNLLPDRIEGFSGIYLGKDFAEFNMICEMYEVSDRKNTFEICKLYDSIIIKHYADKYKQEAKKQERKNKAPPAPGAVKAK